MISFLYILDLTGTFAFAVSGAIAAAEKKMDIYGLFVLALITAVGGGVLRDVLIGKVPPFVFQDVNYLLLAILASILVFFFSKPIGRFRQPLIFMDALGLGVFTVIGVTRAMDTGMSWWGAILMGVITGTVGGMFRDMLANEVPLVLREEVYAAASMAGAILFYVMAVFNLPRELCAVTGGLIVTVLRLVAVRFHWSLPRPPK